MTPQAQADLILQGWQQHRDDTDELMTKLAQDRDALLKALYLSLPFVEDLENDEGFKTDVVKQALRQIRAAIAQAERPR